MLSCMSSLYVLDMNLLLDIPFVNSITLLRSMREVRSEGILQPPKLERLTDKYSKSQLTRAKLRGQKSLCESVPE